MSGGSITSNGGIKMGDKHEWVATGDDYELERISRPDSPNNLVRTVPPRLQTRPTITSSGHIKMGD
jgi:hypothetical protein